MNNTETPSAQSWSKITMPYVDFHSVALGQPSETASNILDLTVCNRWLLATNAVRQGARIHPEVAPYLEDFESGCKLFTNLQRQHPETAQNMVLHPTFGTWLAHSRQVMNGSRNEPVWEHVGQLLAITAAAATHAGMDFELHNIPVQGGTIYFPRLGRAQLGQNARLASISHQAGTITIEAGNNQLRISDTQTAILGWEPVHILHARAAGHAISMELDISKYGDFREIHEPPVEVLDEQALAYWQDTFAQAWKILASDHPTRAPGLARHARTIVPLGQAQRFQPVSASNNLAPGSIMVTRLSGAPEDAEDLAATLVHENQHTILNGLMMFIGLRSKEADKTATASCYAPWRDDPRPPGGVLHGIYSFFGVTDFWRTRSQAAAGRTADRAQFEFAHWRKALWGTIQALPELSGLTEHGEHFVRHVASVVHPWLEEQVPDELQQRANFTTEDHKLLWQAHHLAPNADNVATLVEDWLQHQPPSLEPSAIPATVSRDPTACNLDRSAMLARWCLVDPEGLRRMYQNPGTIPQHIEGATFADVALTVGDIDTAQRHYQEQLSVHPNSPGALIGIGRITPDEAAPLLLRHTALIRAVRAGVARRREGTWVPPLEVAQWLTESSCGGDGRWARLDA